MWDVAVVGAGFAGVAAARRLEAGGLRPVILEASERVGGRVETVVRGQDALDVGGQWIGPAQTRMNDLVREHGLSTFPSWTAGTSLIIEGGRGRRIGPWPGREAVGVALAALPLIVDVARLARRIRTAQGESPLLARLDRITVAEWLASRMTGRRARSWVAAAVREALCVEPEELSLLVLVASIQASGGLRSVFGFDGGAQQDLIREGAGTLVRRMADGLDVHLRSPVRRVAVRPDHVVVTTPVGEVQARSAVIAVPPSMVREIHLEALPGPDPLDWAAAQNTARVIKGIAVYDRPFWRDRGLSGTLILPDGPLGLAADTSPPDGRGRLSLLATGRDADRLHPLSSEDRRRAVLASLRPHLGDAVVRPIEFVERDWVAAPWARGGYSAVPRPGSARIPPPSTTGPVHWAGTETAHEWPGYMEGAVRSGERAADAILARR